MLSTTTRLNLGVQYLPPLPCNELHTCSRKGNKQNDNYCHFFLCWESGYTPGKMLAYNIWDSRSTSTEAIATTAPAFICGVVEVAYHSFPVPSLLPPPSHHEHPHVPPSHWWNVKRQDWAGTTASLRCVDWVLFVFIWAMDGDPISIRVYLSSEDTSR